MEFDSHTEYATPLASVAVVEEQTFVPPVRAGPVQLTVPELDEELVLALEDLAELDCPLEVDVGPELDEVPPEVDVVPALDEVPPEVDVVPALEDESEPPPEPELSPQEYVPEARRAMTAGRIRRE